MAHHLPARLSLTQIRSVLITCDGCVDDEEGKSKVYRDAFHGLLVEVIFHRGAFSKARKLQSQEVGSYRLIIIAMISDLAPNFPSSEVGGNPRTS